MSGKVDVLEAQQMRDAGKTLQEIGAHFGVTRERIRQLVGPMPPGPPDCAQCGEPLPTPRRSNRRYCSRACSAKVYNDKTHYDECPQCRGRKSVTARVCRPCQISNYRTGADNELIVELWSRGESISTIAAALDTTTNALGVRIQRMRKYGFDLPYRRRVFIHGEPAFPDQEIHEYRPESVPVLSLNTKEILARRKMRHRMRATTALHQAIMRGAVIRPDRCSRCGDAGRIEGHHHDYDKPLEVEWLCFACHRKTHAEGRAVA